MNINVYYDLIDLLSACWKSCFVVIMRKVNNNPGFCPRRMQGNNREFV